MEDRELLSKWDGFSHAELALLAALLLMIEPRTPLVERLTAEALRVHGLRHSSPQGE